MYKLLNLFCDERMHKSLINGDAFGWIQQKTLVQEVLQLVDLSQVGIIQSLRAHEDCQQVLGRTNGAHQCDFLLHTHDLVTEQSLPPYLKTIIHGLDTNDSVYEVAN